MKSQSDQRYAQLLLSDRFKAQFLMLELNCDGLEETLKAEDFDTLINLMPKMICAYGAYSGSPAGDRFNQILSKVISGLVAKGDLSSVHKFYSKALSSLYRSRSAIYLQADRTDLEAMELFEHVIVPELILRHEQYLELCRTLQDVGFSKKYEKQLDAIRRGIWLSPKRYPKDRRPMSVEVFWDLVNSARRSLEHADDDDGALEDIRARLLSFSQANVVTFQTILLELCVPLSTSEAWAVGHIVSGNLTEDGFEYFKPWIVLQGQDFYRSFLNDPRAAMLQIAPGTSIQMEEFLVLVEDLFAEKGWSIDKLEKIRRPDTPDIVLNWETEELPEKYPELWHKFIGRPLD